MRPGGFMLLGMAHESQAIPQVAALASQQLPPVSEIVQELSSHPASWHDARQACRAIPTAEESFSVFVGLSLRTFCNAACACALRGGREEDCAKLLGTLAAEGALRRSELEGDVDLAPLVPTAWMQSILSGLPP